MTKKIFLLACAFAMTSVGVFAQEPPSDKKLSYNIALDFGSTYLWRGFDTFEGKSTNTSSSVFNFAPSLFPSITVSSADGLSFNIWGSRALVARTAAEGALDTYDEIDLTGSYSVSDKTGSFTASAIAYLFPSTITTPAVALPSFGELLFSYTAPWDVLNPTIGLAGDFGGINSEYGFLSVGHDFEFGIVSFSPKLFFGYWIANGDSSQNKSHLDLLLPFGFKVSDAFEFHAGLTGSYRISGYNTNYSAFILVMNLGASFSF